MSVESDRIQSEVDALIDWYQVNRPEAAGSEIRVKAPARHLLRFARPVVPGELYSYRGHTLRRVAEDGVH